MNMKKVTLTNPVLMLDLLLKENSAISDIQEELSYTEVFIKDALEHFFCKYDECEENKHSDILRIMLHNAQSYKKYLLVVMNYINQIKDKLSCTENLLNESFIQLTDGAVIEGGECHE